MNILAQAVARFFLNSTIGTANFQPLDKLIASNSVASNEAVYAQTLVNAINADSIDWAFRNSTNIGDTLCKAFNIDSSALRACATLSAMASSSAAMTAIVASDTALAALLASDAAMGAVIVSSAAMNAIVTSSTAMASIAASNTRIAKVATSSAAIAAIVVSSTASTAIIDAIQDKRSQLITALGDTTRFTKSTDIITSSSSATVRTNTPTVCIPTSVQIPTATANSYQVFDVLKSGVRAEGNISTATPVAITNGVCLRGIGLRRTMGNVSIQVNYDIYTAK